MPGTTETNSTIEAVTRDAVALPYIVMAVVEATGKSFTQVLTDLLHGKITALPVPNTIDGPLIGRYVAGCTVAAAATQVQDVGLRNQCLKLASQLVDNITLQDLGVPARSGGAVAP